MQLLVIDTNILVSALMSKNDESMSVRLIEEILDGKYRMCISSEIYDEYADVLHRDYL